MCAKLAYKFEGMTDVLNGTFVEEMSDLLGSATSGKGLTIYEVDTNFEMMVEMIVKSYADYIMYSTFLTVSSGSVLFSRSNLLKRKDLCFSCLRLGLIRHRRSKRSSHLFSSDLPRFSWHSLEN